jgi:hypothetical protein
MISFGEEKERVHERGREYATLLFWYYVVELQGRFVTPATSPNDHSHCPIHLSAWKTLRELGCNSELDGVTHSTILEWKDEKKTM